MLQYRSDHQQEFAPRREKIEKLFPDLAEIRDAKLGAKVIAVWTESVTKGGWEPEELEAIPFTLLAGEIAMPLSNTSAYA